jgi:preprotein translocase subunit SecA
LLKLVSRFAGDPNEKELDRLQPLVDAVGELESRFKDLTDQQLRDHTADFLARLDAGHGLDELLPEAFAAVREASKRTTSMRHFDVQILGGIILHEGKVVEMKTGEGKTLVATLPLYLNALAGLGAHLVTVNDYLARRDVQWMGPIYHLLGLTIGLLQQGEDKAFVYDPEYARGDFKHLRPVSRKEAYQAHITYGTNHEFGFDYLRDNLAYTLDRRVQRELHYAIIDEVDNILIDEARTPLIISGPSDEPIEEYRRFAHIARKLLSDVDYEMDEKERNVILTEAGLAKVEAETGIENIYDEANYQYVHYMEQALRAHVLYHKDRDYIKQGQRIVLVDEFTGRLMPDRRLSEGLHQAIEAKEGVPIRPRMMTQATVTLQNYFRMYEKLAGMTGTAATEAEELDKIYKLDVLVLPTNVEYMARGPDASLAEKRHKEDGIEIVEYCERQNPDEPLYYRRSDYEDVIYKSEKAKWTAITEEIEELNRLGRPVLVGTTSVEKSERLSGLLKAKNISHEVLNAKNHTREAAIIACAGEPGSVTIATNMAGRGVDIKLGGELSDDTIRAAHRLLQGRGVDPYRATSAQLYTAIAEVEPDYVRRREEVLELGGLHVLGTERHEARRIDNQLRGRAGRQGEPGSSRFFLSLEDDLMRRFGGPSVANLMDRLGVEEEIPIEHGMVSKTIEGAQTKVEGYNFDIRKHL